MERLTLHAVNVYRFVYVVEKGAGPPGADSGWENGFKTSNDTPGDVLTNVHAFVQFIFRHLNFLKLQ